MEGSRRTAFMRFTIGDVIQLVTVLVAGMMMYADLKGDVREVRANVAAVKDEVQYRATGTDRRLERLESRRSR